MSDKKKIYVYADWNELEMPTLMGVLFVELLRGKEIFSFEYTEDWLCSKNTQFSSAMTLLGYTDGVGAEDGISYLELVEFIIQHGANVKEDLTELFRRIVFSIAVSNTDDHLRNHGFILTKQGWRLSPAYDINPNPYGTGLKLNISEDDNSLDFDLALSVAPYFRLTEQEATGIVGNIKSAVSDWEKVAIKYQISKSEREMMSPAFIFPHLNA